VAEREEVTVRRSELSLPTAEGATRTIVYVTYFSRDMPPGLVTIPKDEWTEAHEAELIKADLEARRKAKPATVKL